MNGSWVYYYSLIYIIYNGFVCFFFFNPTLIVSPSQCHCYCVSLLNLLFCLINYNVYYEFSDFFFCVSCYSFIYLLKLNIVDDFTKMNTESEKSTEEVVPLWKYVTKLEKASVGGGNVAFKCNYCEKTFKGSYSRVKAHLLKLSNFGIQPCAKVGDEY